MRHQDRRLSGRLNGVALIPALLVLSATFSSRLEPLRVPEVPAAATPTGTSPAQVVPPVPVKALPTPAPAPAPPKALPEVPGRAAEGPVATVEGQVVDAVTGKPVQGAEVSLPELSRSVQTDPEGRFTLPAVPVRKRRHELLITCPTYSSTTRDLRVASEGTTLTVPEIRLKPKGW